MIRSGGVKYHDALEPLMEDITKVRPHPDNPSSGDQEQIAVSIEVSGMYRPVEAQRSTGYILAGNTTYAACLLLDATVLPVIWLDVDDEAALRILLGDNQLARLAIVDQGLLTPLVERLLETEMRLLGTGYDEPSLPPEVEIEPAHMVCVNLTGDNMVSWFDLPVDTDRERLLHLLDQWRADR